LLVQTCWPSSRSSVCWALRVLDRQQICSPFNIRLPQSNSKRRMEPELRPSGPAAPSSNFLNGLAAILDHREHQRRSVEVGAQCYISQGWSLLRAHTVCDSTSGLPLAVTSCQPLPKTSTTCTHVAHKSIRCVTSAMVEYRV